MQKIIKLIKDKQHVIFPFLDIALNGVNYLFHIYVSWYLFASDYGILNSLLALSAILFVTGISFQTYTAKQISKEKSNRSFSEIIKLGLFSGMIISVLLLAISPFLISITRSDFLSIILVMAIFLSNLILSILRGGFQGRKEFLNLNASFYIEVLSKVFILFIFLRYFSNIHFVLLSILIGMVLSLLHGYLKNKKHIHIKTAKTMVIKNRLRILSKIFIANFFLYFFTSIDMILVNYFIPEISGVFAVVLKYSQIIMFVGFSIITVFIPLLSGSKDEEEFKKYFRKIFFIMIFLAVLGIIFYSLILPLTVDFFFDDQYSDASNYLLVGAVPYILLAFSFLMVNVNIILEKTKHLFILGISSVFLFIGLILFHDSIKTVFTVETIVYGILLASLFVEYIIQRRKKI